MKSFTNIAYSEREQCMSWHKVPVLGSFCYWEVLNDDGNLYFSNQPTCSVLYRLVSFLGLSFPLHAKTVGQELLMFFKE